MLKNIIYFIYGISLILTGCQNLPKETALTGNYNQKVHIEVQGKVNYKDFSLQLIREYDPEENFEIKSTKNLIVREYEITSNNHSKKIVKVVYGQLPPLPKEFSYGINNYVLHTYSTPSGDIIYPDKIYIEKK